MLRLGAAALMVLVGLAPAAIGASPASRDLVEELNHLLPAALHEVVCRPLKTRPRRRLKW